MSESCGAFTCGRCGQRYTPRTWNQKRCGPCIPLFNAENNRAKARAAYRRKAATPDGIRRETLRHCGTTPEAYAEMLEKQGGVCAICHKPPRGHGHKHLAVDHDHSCCPGAKSCGECIRGLLCMYCNKGLGMFNDDPAALRAAITYLQYGAGTIREAAGIVG